MAEGAGDLLTVVAIGTGINALSVARKTGPEGVFGVAFGGIAMFSTLAIIGTVYDWRLAKQFAWLFVFASVLFRGEGVVNWFTIALGNSSNLPNLATKTGNIDTSNKDAFKK